MKAEEVEKILQSERFKDKVMTTKLLLKYYETHKDKRPAIYDSLIQIGHSECMAKRLLGSKIIFVEPLNSAEQ